MPSVSYSQGNHTLTLPEESYLCCSSGILNDTLIYPQNYPHWGSNYRVTLSHLTLELYFRFLNPSFLDYRSEDKTGRICIKFLKHPMCVRHHYHYYKKY